MRTSLTMLILMTLICSTFAIVVNSSTTLGSEDDTAVVDDLEIQSPYVQEYEPGTQEEEVDIPVSASGRSEGLWQGDDLEIETSINEVFEGIEYGSRGAVNTSTLIYIKKSEKKVLYNQIFEMSGELLEDNNSDGEKNAGDYPIIGAWVDLLWNDGSEFMVQKPMQTQPDNPDLNLTAGLWNITLQANETNIAANGDPNSAHPGVEFVVTYKGEWTTDGRRFYNLTPKVYTDLFETKIGYDDDGDSVEKLYNGVDDDNDGVVDDGRPGIDAVGAPEIPSEWYNGVDDDGDGIADDGYPGIKTLNNAEGVDEELYNGRDDDGDGEVDEDPYAFIARRGYEKRMYVEIWHNTQTSFTLHESVVDIGDTFTLDGKIEDISVPETNMGAKTMRMFFDGQFVSETHADPASTKPWSVFDFSWEVPQKVTAGPHTITVEFSPAFNKTNNYYWNPSNASVTIHVRRPTAVIFDVGDPTTMKTYVYRGDSIWINGSIVDKIKYEVDKVKEGPRLKIGGYDYAHEYSFRMWWGDVNNYENYWPDQTVIDDNGTFSVGFEIRSDIVLGDWTIMVETSFKTDPMHIPLLYYINSENQTKYQVRAKTDMGLWIDQNQNGEPDFNDRDPNGMPVNTFITRKPFVGPDGRTYNWNYARIRGKLKDLSQTPGSINEGVAYEDVTLYWGFSKSWQQEFELQTKEDGEFEIDIKIETSHALGPVPVLVVFSAEFYSNYYDSSNYRDFDGMPFSVVSFTQLEVNASTGIKGKAVEIKGELLDDRGVGIGNRTVSIYRKDDYTGNYDDLKSDGPGILIGSAVTNSIGKFTFEEYTIGEDVNVGRSFIVAKFGGSVQFPDGPSGIRYYPNDAYMDIIAVPDEFYITSETAVVLDEKSFPDVLVRNGEARIAGQLVESYKGQPKQKGIGNMLITAYLKQGDEILRMGVDKTQTSAEFRGMFEIKTTNVPSTLDVGKVTVMVEFTPEPVDVGVPLYRSSSNITDAEIWSSTRVDTIQVGPVDQDGDRKIDLKEDEIEDWIFSFRVLEGATADSSGEPVSYATVWFNLSMGAYTNTTRGTTDSRGKITFNFTQKFKDTATGATFVIPDGKEFDNLTIKVTFVGKHYFTSSTRTLPASYWEATKADPASVPVAMIIFLSLLLLIILIVSLFFFYRWIEKKRRLKALKRIIKKAADQLETGNPYSAVIFKSYQKLGAHLRRYGFMRRDADTFREFEDAVRTALPIDDRALDTFLDLLEEARYSKHVIGEGHRDKAIGCLRNVEKSLDNIMLDEESALRQMELQDEEFVETEVVLKDR